MKSLGLVVALCARAGMYPDEYDQMLRIQELTVISKSLDPNVLKSQVGDYLRLTHHLSTTFGLRMVGGGRRAMPHGYIRLPTSLAAKAFYPKMAPARIRVSRFEPDLSVIRGWACFE